MQGKNIKERDPNEQWVQYIGTKIQVYNDPPYRQVFIDAIKVADYIIGSKFEEAAVLVLLLNSNLVSVPNLANAFGIHHKTLYTYLSSYKSDGLEGLRPLAQYPGKVSNVVVSYIQERQLKNPNLTLVMLNRELSHKFQLTLSTSTINKLMDTQLIGPLAKERDGL